MRHARLLASLLVLAVAAGGCSLPQLGDSQTTVVSLQVADHAGLGEKDREQVEQILRQRVTGAGLPKPSFSMKDDGTLVMSVRGNHRDDDFPLLAAPGRLEFRKVVDLTQPPGSAPGLSRGTETTQEAVFAKVGPQAVGAANALTEPAPAHMPALDPFAALTGAEVAVLPTRMQFTVPQVGCGALKLRPRRSISADQQLVACDGDGRKYLLDVTKVARSDVRSAKSSLDPSRQYVVTIGFTTSGQARFTDLSREAVGNAGTPPCAQSALGGSGNCLVGIVLDGVVLSAPEILAVLTGDAVISGNFTKDGAKRLAALLGTAELPVELEVEAVDVIGA
jgi:preprotein translocase subunit SecD